MSLGFIALLPFLLQITQAQLKVCTDGGAGPCITGRCPLASQQCIQTAQGEVCCDNDKIVDATATTTTAPCVDKVNPRTGVSDCPNTSYLCNNALYFQLMTEQCPKTCNRCPGTAVTAPTSTCQDFVNPRTGQSDCPQMESYCRNALYMQLMREQCPKTCKYCN